MMGVVQPSASRMGWIGWVRVGGAAAQDCTELGVELDLSPIELDLSQLVVDNGSPVEQLLRRSLRLRQAATEPGQRGVVDRFIETAFAD